MGYMRHHAIVVTSCFEPPIRHAHGAALAYFYSSSASVSSILGPTRVNGYYSFFVTPDGSKEGWEESDAGDRAREGFIARLEKLYELGEFCAWAEIQFGDEDGEAKLTASSDGYLRPKEEV